MGTSAFLRLLDKHFLQVSICPHKEDYCNTCKARDLSTCTFVLRKIRKSGHSLEETLRQHKTELAELKKTQKNHLLDFYNEIVERCNED